MVMQTMNTSELNRIRIRDTHLAAYLLARGFQIVGVSGPNGQRDFIFQDVPSETIASFYGGDDRISSRALLDALRNVRGLLAQPLGERAEAAQAGRRS